MLCYAMLGEQRMFITVRTAPLVRLVRRVLAEEEADR